MNATRELKSIAEGLRFRFADVSIRGEGAAAFVFAAHAGRAVEVSRAGEVWWMEFWEADRGEDEPPAREATAEDANAAVSDLEAWLAGSASPMAARPFPASVSALSTGPLQPVG